MIDVSEFKKYHAMFDVVVFTDDGDAMLDDAECVFLAKDVNFARYLAVYSMIDDLKLCNVAVKSISLVGVKEV